MMIRAECVSQFAFLHDNERHAIRDAPVLVRMRHEKRKCFVIQHYVKHDDLKRGQRVQLHLFHAPGQRIAKVGQQQQISRTREHQAAGPPVVVHRQLERAQQLRHSLYLVEDGARRQRRHKAGRINPGEGKRGRIVEADVGVARPEPARQCGLARLSRPPPARTLRAYRAVQPSGTLPVAGRRASCKSVLLPVNIASDCLLRNRPIAYYASVQLPVRRRAASRRRRNA